MNGNQFIKITPEILIEAMQEEINGVAYYERLMEMAPDVEDKEMIRGIRNDEESHYNAIVELYTQLTGRSSEPLKAEVPKIPSFSEGVKYAYLEELEDSKFYRKIALQCDNPGERLFFDIMSDENKHAALLNYIYLKLLEDCCEEEHIPEIPEPEIPICEGIAHTVQSGESLSVIAVRYGVALEKILEVNPQISNPDNIYIGQIICIPCLGITYTIQSGDSLWRIAQNFGLTVNDILAFNPQITDANNIVVGNVLCIPKSETRMDRVSLTYLFNGTSSQYLDWLSKTQNSINTVCPDYFEVDDSGNLLVASSNKLNREFIDEMHKKGILVTPFLTNHFNRRLGVAALSNREQLSSQIADVIEEYDLDGIDVDIENVTHEQRDEYTDFMRLLREKLPNNKIVSTAVAANPNGWTLGWHGSYDYKALSNYCDYLMIMAYDESYQGSPEGPVSSRDFFERSIQFALNEGVPKEKIVVGIPFFGRFWKQDTNLNGIGLASRDVEFLMENYTSSGYYDEARQSVFATVTIRPGEPEPPIWGGRRLTAGTYNIWYDSPEATRYKLRTINKYDVLGAGSWALSQEILSIWDFYKEALNK